MNHRRWAHLRRAGAIRCLRTERRGKNQQGGEYGGTNHHLLLRSKSCHLVIWLSGQLIGQSINQ
jgi:hypothetical protein